jgi:hypothetical protein
VQTTISVFLPRGSTVFLPSSLTKSSSSPALGLSTTLTKGGARRQILRSCCLVSKRIIARAQPLLWQFLVVKPFQNFSRCFELALHTERGRTLLKIVRSVDAVWVPPAWASAILQRTMNVREIYLDFSEGSFGQLFDLRPLRLLPSELSLLRPSSSFCSSAALSFLFSSSFTFCCHLPFKELMPLPCADLNNLTLAFVNLTPLINPFRLSSLRSLSLLGVIIPPHKLAILLSQCVPSLVALAVGTCFEATGKKTSERDLPVGGARLHEASIFPGSKPYTPSIPSDVYERLETVQVNGFEPYGVVEAGSLAVLRTITSAYDLDYLEPLSHIRYLLHPSEISDILTHGVDENGDYPFSELANEVFSSPPRSLHLPAIFLDANTNGALIGNPNLRDLLDACAVANVEVVWHDDDGEKPYLVSPSFHQYVKELKAKQQSE